MSSPVRFYGLEGPVWLPANAPARMLYPPVERRRAKVLFLGASVSSHTPNASDMAAAGWLSRSIPLLLSENAFVLLGLDTVALVPWSVGRGFVVLPQPWSVEGAAMASAKASANLCVMMDVISGPEAATLAVRLLRGAANGAAEELAEWSSEIAWENPAEALHGAWARLANSLVAELGDTPVPPTAERYKVPGGPGLLAYLQALEGVSGLRCQGTEAGNSGVLPGQHAAIRQAMSLAQAHPGSLPARLLLHEGLLRMRTLDKSYTESLADEVKALHVNAAFRDQAVTAILEQQFRFLYAG